MNETQAAVGRAQLKKLKMLIDKRRENSHYLSDGLQGIKGITIPYEDPNCYHSFHLYTLCVEEEVLGASRNEFMRVLYQEEGIQGIQHYQPNGSPQWEASVDLDMIIEGVKNAANKVRK